MNDIQSVIAAIGVRQLAAQLGENVHTVSKWRQRNRVPADRLQAVFEAARTHGLDLTAEQILEFAAGPSEVA